MDVFTSYHMKYLLSIQQMIPLIIKCLVLILFFEFKFEARFQKLYKTRFAQQIDTIQTKSPGGVLQKYCSEKFRKFHTKTTVSDFPFNKIRGLRLTALLKTDSNTGVFLRILPKLLNHLLKNSSRQLLLTLLSYVNVLIAYAIFYLCYSKRIRLTVILVQYEYSGKTCIFPNDYGVYRVLCVKYYT